MKSESDRGAVQLDFGSFSAKAKDFQNERGEGFKSVVQQEVGKAKYRLFLDLGDIIYVAIKPIVEQEASGVPSQHVCQGQTASFDGYADIFTDEFFEDLVDTKWKARFTKWRIVSLRDRLGKDWNDAAALDLDNDGLKELHESELLEDLQQFVILFIQALRKSMLGKKPLTPDQQYWTNVLFSQELNRIVQGQDADQAWLDQPWTNPVVKLWVSLLAAFDASGAAASDDFVERFTGALSSVTATGDDKQSVFQAIADFESLWHEVGDSFDTKEALVEWLDTVFRIAVFRRAAHDSTSSEALAWREADRYMLLKRQRGVKPQLKDTDQAIEEAKKFLKRAADTKQSASTDLSTQEELKALRAEVELLRGKPGLPQQQKPSAPPQDQHSRCEYCASKGYTPVVHNLKHGCRRQCEDQLKIMDGLRSQRKKQTAKKLAKAANKVAKLDNASNKSDDE